MTEADPSRIAVVIPAYNHAPYLADTIRSVLAQTRRPDRILVLDDGSRDDTAQIAESFAQDSVEVGRQENAGAHITLNRLVAKAAADCGTIAILNSDDQYLPHRLETCLADLDTHPEAGLVVTPLELIDDDGGPLPPDHPRARWFAAAWETRKQDHISLPSWLGVANFPATTSNIVARSSYLLANPFRSYLYCHDYFLLATAAAEGRMHVLQGTPQLRYRVHASNTITTAPAKLVREMLRMRLDLARHLVPQAVADPEAHTRLADLLQGFWGSLSSIPEADAQLALALALRQLDDDALAKIVDDIPEAHLAEFPNKAIINSATETHPLGRSPELARKIGALIKDKAYYKGRADDLLQLARLRHHLAASRWLALGSLLGFTRSLKKNRGKSTSEKRRALQLAIAKNTWLNLGALLGSLSCKELQSK